MSDNRPGTVVPRRSTAEVRHSASELALEAEVIRVHIRRMQARLRVIQEALGREMVNLEIRQELDAPLMLPGVPVGALEGDTNDSQGDGVYSDVTSEDVEAGLCLHPIRGNPRNLCARTKGHRGSHRSFEAQQRRAENMRTKRGAARP